MLETCIDSAWSVWRATAAPLLNFCLATSWSDLLRGDSEAATAEGDIGPFPLEILLLVLRDLHRPLPLPHRKPPDEPKRADMRQPELAACMRVCKQWHNIVGPMLYETVASDSVPLLLAGIEEHHFTWRRSKIELLGLVRRLFLEYSYRPPSSERPNARRIEANQCQAVSEAAAMSRAWERLSLHGRSRIVFRSLRTLSTGALYGLQDEVWTPTSEAARRALDDVRRAFLDVVTHDLPIEHFCQAGLVGPLCLGCNLVARPNGDTLSISTHQRTVPLIDPRFFTVPLIHPPVSLGSRTRWYMHFDPSSGASTQAFRYRDPGNIDHLLYHRRLAEQHRRRVGSWDLDGATYFIGHPFGGSEPDTEQGKREWRELMEGMQRQVGASLQIEQLRLFFTVEVQDKWEIKPLFDAPPCEACGWTHQYRV